MNSTRGDGDESEQGVSEEGQAEGASAQQMQGRRPPYPPRPRLLTDDEHRRVVELRLCFSATRRAIASETRRAKRQGSRSASRRRRS